MIVVLGLGYQYRIRNAADKDLRKNRLPATGYRLTISIPWIHDG